MFPLHWTCIWLETATFFYMSLQYTLQRSVFSGHNSMIYFVDEVGPSPLAQSVAFRDLPLRDVGQKSFLIVLLILFMISYVALMIWAELYGYVGIFQVLYISERVVIGVGFDCNPMVFIADERGLWLAPLWPLYAQYLLNCSSSSSSCLLLIDSLTCRFFLSHFIMNSICAWNVHFEKLCVIMSNAFGTSCWFFNNRKISVLPQVKCVPFKWQYIFCTLLFSNLRKEFSWYGESFSSIKCL